MMLPEITSLSDCALADIIEGLEKSNFTSLDLVRAYLARIGEVDDEFHSVIEINPDAMEIARRMDVERLSKGSRGALHGVPLLLKDNLVTHDAMETTCGSYALVGAKAPKESTVVTILRKAGAIILGKANMAEFSGFRSTSGCSGWSARGGQARGIYFPNMKASGSSSGSAISTALGLCGASLGTETVFSIASPAERSGIVGYKPTRDLIPTEGIIHASYRQDTIGLLSRTVADSVTIVAELVKQRKCPVAEDIYDKFQTLLLTSLCPEESRSFRIGILKEFAGEIRNMHRFKGKHFNSILEKMVEAGTIVEDVVIAGFQTYEKLSEAEKNILLDTELKVATNDYLKSLTTNPHNIQDMGDLIDFLKTCPEEDYPRRNVAVLERAEKTDPHDQLYLTMLEKDEYFAGEGGISGTLDRYNLDVLIIPTLSWTLQAFAAKAGSPVVSVPIGVFPKDTVVETDQTNGLVTVAPGIPFSLYIYGRPHDDDKVLRVAAFLEQLTQVRKQLNPYKIPSVDLIDFANTSSSKCTRTVEETVPTKIRSVISTLSNSPLRTRPVEHRCKSKVLATDLPKLSTTYKA